MTTTTTPYYPQLAERDCGATCLRMVAEHFGVRMSMAYLREVTETTESGTDLGGIEAGARALGFETLAAELPYDELAAGDLLPAILHWDRDHFVVVSSADEYSANVLDPAAGARRLKRADFEAHRYGPGRSRAGLVVRAANRDTATAAHAPPPPAGDTGDVPADPTGRPRRGRAHAADYPPPLNLWLGGAFLATALVALGAVFSAAVRQAVDLQLYAAWPRHLGSVLLASAAAALAMYTLRKLAIAYGVARARVDGLAIAASSSLVGSPASGDGREKARAHALGLVDDADAIRNWFAYDLASVGTAGATAVAAVAVCASVDVWISAALAVGSLLTLATWRGLRERSDGNRRDAEEAAALRFEAEREFAGAAAEGALYGAGDWLGGRLARARGRANAAYARVAREFVAQEQLLTGALWLTVMLVAATGLYRLGYAGVQVGSLTVGLVLALVTTQALSRGLRAMARWRRLRTSRLRLEEARLLATGGQATPPEDGARATLLVLEERSEGAGGTSVEIPLPSLLAFVGPDAALRRRVVDDLLGAPVPDGQPRLVRLFGEDDRPCGAAALGRVAVVRAGDDLLNATIAENITLSARPDAHRLEEAANVVGLDGYDLPHGLATRPAELPDAERDASVVRVLIARAVYADIDTLVLDGATEPLTAYDEGVLLDALLRWAAGKTLILSTASVQAAFGFHRVAYLAAGEIESYGTHGELMDRRGAYYYDVLAREPRHP